MSIIENLEIIEAIDKNSSSKKSTIQNLISFYFQFRYQSPDRLSRVINKLHQWELDFHDQDHNEVLKCWRLHLGSCDVLKDVIEAQNYDSNSFRNSLKNKVTPSPSLDVQHSLFCCQSFSCPMVRCVIVSYRRFGMCSKYKQ